MTNRDKYLKEGVDKELFVEEMANLLDRWKYVKDEYISCRAYVKEWVTEPVQPTLTEDERVILRNIDKEKYQYIRRERNIFVYSKNNFKTGGKYINTCPLPFNLFQFIKERRTI